MQQHTEEWMKARLGKVTASRVADMVAKTKTGWGAGRKNYAAELVIERLTGAPIERYQNAAMAYGTECEPEARAAYAWERKVDVAEVGFVPHPTIAMAGASPDGLVGADGLCELKCPNTATHIETLLSGKIDAAYIDQMQFQMACTGRHWCDYVSYDRRLPEAMRLFVLRVHRNNDKINDLERAAREFLAEIDATVAELAARYPMEQAAA